MNAEMVTWLEESGGWIDRQQGDRVFSVFQQINVGPDFRVWASTKVH